MRYSDHRFPLILSAMLLKYFVTFL